jgi:nucleoside-diphosphate-sugar epimerase
MIRASFRSRGEQDGGYRGKNHAVRTLLLTGSEGYVGSSLAPSLAAEVDLVTVDRRPPSARRGRKLHLELDLASQADEVRRALARERLDLDAILHLAGLPDASSPWDALYADNVLATLRMHELARELEVPKFLFASSVHVVDGYVRHPERWPVRTDDEVWPSSAYGVSKIVGETFLRMLCEDAPIRGYALRICAYWDPRGALHSFPGADALFLHAEDFAQIVRLCLRDEAVGGFVKLFCTSNVSRPVVDISETKRLLGYEPQHDAADFYEPVK